MPTDVPVLSCTELVKRYGDATVVDHLNFTIRPSETYGLLGPNGAGKTTTISMIAGLLQPTEGVVEVCGKRVSPTAIDAKRHIGLVPQDLAIYPDLNGRENLEFFARLQGLGKAERRTRIDQVLDVIGLRDRANDLAKEYSGGMQRRLNIGIGMLHRPDLLILDEPTVGVDPQSRNAILDAVEALSGEGMAVLYTTHYMEEAERLCNRVGIVDHGVLQAEGTQDELIRLTGEVDSVTLSGTGNTGDAAQRISQLPSVTHATATASSVTATVTDASAAMVQLVSTASGAGMTLLDVEVARPDLESVFLHLTGRALRD